MRRFSLLYFSLRLSLYGVLFVRFSLHSCGYCIYVVFLFRFLVTVSVISPGELFAPEVKGVASGVATAFNWTLAFVVTLTFAPPVSGITEAGVFWLFAAICFAGVGYIVIFGYETKGKTLQEIQDHFRS